MFAFDNYRLKYFKLPLLICTCALCTLGILVLSSAVANDPTGHATIVKQMQGIAMGAGLMLVLTIIDYHFWLRLYPIIFLGMTGILLLVYSPLGETYKGATRWLRIPGIGQLQPSEFAKIAMILFFAWYMNRFREQINRFGVLCLMLILFAIPALLIYMEPDLSTTLVFTITFLSMLYVAGISYKWIGGAVLVAVPVAGVLLWDCLQEEPRFVKLYMKNRVMSFLYPELYASSGLNDQQQKAVMAISSGRLQGKGLNNTSFESVKNGNFLSEENCDFIFAVIGEELGFIGSLLVLGLFVLLIFLCYRTAARARDMAGRLICVGVGTLIAVQAFFNIGVTSGMLPNTGIPLPFFSAGLSSLVSLFIGLGLVMNVALQRREWGEGDWQA